VTAARVERRWSRSSAEGVPELKGFATVAVAVLVVIAIGVGILAGTPSGSLSTSSTTAGPTSSSMNVPSATTAPHGAPSTTVQQTSAGKVVTLARLPKRFVFDWCEAPPVLAGAGHEVVALVEPSSEPNCPPPVLTLARVELPSGRFVLGPRVAGVASLFAGPDGQVFLINLSGGAIGHFEVWRVPADLRPVPLVRLPFTEATAVQGSPYTDPSIAVAVVPREDDAWIADSDHVELVNLTTGAVATRPAPSNALGNITALALPSASGPLYATFCGRRVPFSCGEIAEIAPSSWRVISRRWYGGPAFYGRYTLVATTAGGWLGAGGGGNGAWVDLYSASGLRPTSVTEDIGWNALLATGDVVWASQGGGGALGCFSASAAGSVRSTSIAAGEFLGAGYPLGVESPYRDLVVATVQPATLVAVPIPRACFAAAG